MLAASLVASGSGSSRPTCPTAPRVAGQALVAHALARDLAGARAAAARLLRWALVLGIGVGAVVAVARHPLAGLFTDDPVVAATAASTRCGGWPPHSRSTPAPSRSTASWWAPGASGSSAVAMLAAAGVFGLATAVAVASEPSGVALWPVWVGLAAFMVARLVPAAVVAGGLGRPATEVGPGSA